MAEKVKLTITEALADIKTIDKRIEKKQEFILGYLFRQSALKDPLEKDGGCFVAIEKEMQAIHDLEEYKLKLRRAIQVANETTKITILGDTRTLADWLVWRREVSPQLEELYEQISRKIQEVRKTALQKSASIAFDEKTATNPMDFIVHIDEKEILESAEHLEEVLGALDGQLSLKNATVLIEL